MYFTLWVGGMFCLVGLVSLASARSNEEDRQPSISIVGGTQALEGEFPALGVIAADVDGTGTRPICAGTLITPSHLLTAAHCTKWHSVSTVDPPMVGFANNLDHPVKAFAILVKRIVHEHWDPLTYRNDIAIIVLKSPIKNIPLTKLPMASSVAKPAATTRRPTTRRPVTRRPTTRRPTMKQPTKKQNVKPKAKARATRATRAFSSYANARAVIAGWGALAYGSSANSASLLLMKANVTIHDNSVCIQQFHGMNAFYPTEMLCASDPGRDTCQGDSGGPIYVNGTQVGITSWSLGCAESHYAGVYTRITNYVDWIAKTIAENKPKNVTHALNN